MAGRPIRHIHLDEIQRQQLEQRARHQDYRLAERARIILCRASGLTRAQTSQCLGCQPKTVTHWTRRFNTSGLPGLDDQPGRGRKKKPLEDSAISPHDASRRDTDYQASPVNMLMVSRKAGVSPMTVSRVLSNHPNVRGELRNRVMQAAADCGYQPDPELRKLMIHLRKRKAQSRHNKICSLVAEAWKNARASSYFSSLANGARARVASLGFTWETFPLESFLENSSRSADILYHRGVEGILLLPAPVPLYEDFYPSESCWERFSVVIATSAAISMPLRRVMPDYFRNMKLICTRLANQGYERIGLALPEDFDRRTFGNYTGAFSAFHLSENKEIVPPCLYGNKNLFEDPLSIRQIRRWYQHYKPQVIIIDSNTVANEFRDLLKDLSPSGKLPLAAVTLLDKNSTVAGIDEQPGGIGAIAAETLGSMIVHNEKGLPSLPTASMIEGVWRGPRY